MRKILSLILILTFAAAGPLNAAAPDDSAELKKAADLYFTGNPAQALEKYLTISKITASKDSFLNATFIALEQNKPQLAVDAIAAAVKKYPKDPMVQELAGEAFLATGHFLNAEGIFSRLAKSSKKEDFYYISLARAQIGLNEDEEAIKSLSQAAAGSLQALANYLLGDIYTKAKNYQSAADAYGKVVTYDFQFLEAKEKYAAALAQLKNYNEALRNYSQIWAMDKSSPSVRKGMEQARKHATPDKAKPDDKKDTAPVKQKHTIVKKPSQDEGKLPQIKVGLSSQIDGSPSWLKNIKFSTSHDFRAQDKNGKTIISGKAGAVWRAATEKGRPYLIAPDGKKYAFSGSARLKQNSTDEAGHTTILQNIIAGAGTTWLSRENREYRGDIEFVYNNPNKGFAIINHVNIEEYVYGVIRAEMPVNFPVEALKAQAVIARTYGLNSLGKHKKWGYDVCDTQHSQVYGGVSSEHERTIAAADGTAGLALTHKGRPIHAVFSSNSGGFTQSSAEAGWFAHDYLKPVCDYREPLDIDKIQPYQFKQLLQHPRAAYGQFSDATISPSNYRWARVVSVQHIQDVAKRRKDIGAITAVIPTARGRSGYVSSVKIEGKKGSLILSKENDIKRYLSLGMLRSTYFTVQPIYEGGKLTSFIFYGGGWGHGVGLCQTGAGGRAQAGQKYQQILQHYYTGAKLEDIRK